MNERPKRAESAASATDPLEMGGEGDADLLALMSMKGEYPEHAREAWAEFYRRHAPYLYHVCRKVLEGLPRPPATAEEVTTDTFMLAYQGAGTYCEPAGLDPDAKRRNVRAWLTQIAHNHVCALLRGVPEVGAEEQLDEERWRQQAAREPDDELPKTELLLALEDVLQTDLDEREREVLRKTSQYHVFGRRAQRLPNKVAEELAKRLGTTTENLRKIRQRALQKVRAGLERRLGKLPQ